MSTELDAKIKRLKERQYEIDAEHKRLYKEIDDAEVALAEEQMKYIDSHIPKYEAKLERIRRYVEDFATNKPGRYRENIKYAFRKVDIYKDDFHDPMPDPLNWKISEYDLLDMDQYVEITFDYHSEAVKRFVANWMRGHVSQACEDDVESFFGFNH